MVVIESCENNVSGSNARAVLDGHANEVSSKDTMTNKVVSQDPERIEETKECLVQPRVSLRLQNRAKVKYGSDQKKPMCDCCNENKFVQKKTKLNPSMQKQVFQLCEVVGGTGLISNYTNDFPQGMDITTILKLKEILRLDNLRKLQSTEEEQNRCKSEENNNMGVAEFSRRKIRSARGKEVPEVPSSYPWYAISKQGCDFLSLVCKDISNGLEDIHIPVINEYDVPPIAPTGFKYIKSLQFSKNIMIPSRVDGCRCKGSCTRTKDCSCVNLNGSIPYLNDSRNRNGSRLFFPKDVVYECGPSCGCGPKCGNKVSQAGLKYRLQVFRTPNKGWGVRTVDNIPAGAPICEYIGELCRSGEVDNITNDVYLFNIDCKETINGIEGRERRLISVSLLTSPSNEKMDDNTAETEPEFCIDGSSCGNVSRFINHSCDPNLFVQCVLSSHHDIKQARIVLFSATKIRPYQELTYDYGYKLDSVVGPDGNIKQMPCNCGEANCRKRLY